jgi:hypothetical protein
MKQIEIKWSYPKEIDSAWSSDDSYGRGVYQITRLYRGVEELYYIGLVKSNNRDFYHRIDEHRGWINELSGVVKIRFGKIIPKRGLQQVDTLIETIEGVLIYEHKPIKNKAKVKSYTLHHNVYIFNVGYRGLLKKELNSNDHIYSE